MITAIAPTVILHHAYAELRGSLAKNPFNGYVRNRGCLFRDKTRSPWAAYDCGRSTQSRMEDWPSRQDSVGVPVAICWAELLVSAGDSPGKHGWRVTSTMPTSYHEHLSPQPTPQYFKFT